LASKNSNPLASLAKVFFLKADPSYVFGQLFSDLKCLLALKKKIIIKKKIEGFV
jgi:hypothetical protein